MLWLHGFVNKIVYKLSFFILFYFFYKMYLCSASDIMSVHTMTILHLNKSCYTFTGFAEHCPFLYFGKPTLNSGSPAAVVAWGRPAFSLKCRAAR